MNIEEQTERFWELAEPLMGGAVAEGTMMGSRCLRVDGDFAAMIHSRTGDLIVKLPGESVLSEIESGHGDSFAPNGKVFKEWLLVTATEDDSWERLIRAAVSYADSGSELPG